MNKYSVDLLIKKFYGGGTLPLSYRSGMNSEERQVWKESIVSKVSELMAFPDTMYDMPIVNLLLSKQRDTYRIEKYEMSTEPDLWVTFFVLIPNHASEENKTPGVLCLPGTEWTKEALCAEDFSDLEYDPPQPRIGIGHRYYYANAQALHFVRNGMTAIACEDFGVGEHAGSLSPEQVAVLLMDQGRNMMGLTVEVRLGMLKWLKSQPFVDAGNLAVAGHSLGVDSAMHVILLDEDVKAFVYNDFLADARQRIVATVPPEGIPEGPWHKYPGIHQWYGYPDLLAAYAPRKLLITEGGSTECLENLKKVYEELGTPENYQYTYYREYMDPENRKYDYVPLKEGMTWEEYAKYVNVVEEKHFFKFETAVPWLKEALK